MRSARVAVMVLWLSAMVAANHTETLAATTLRTNWGSNADRSNISRRKDRLQPSADIVGGMFAKSKNFPYQVYIRIFHRADGLEDAKTSFCGGAIIGKRHILTAAHCVKKDTVHRIEIVAGVQNRWSKAAWKFKIISKSIYKKRDNENVDGDIAVLTVDRSIPLATLDIKLLDLARTKIPPNTECLVAGWGDSKDSEDEDLLKYVALRVSTEDECRSANPEDATGDLLCAGVMGGGKDTCQGDSGSPLVCGRQIVGVVKGGRGCGIPGFPGTYTEVSYYRKWLRTIVAFNESVLALSGDRGKWNRQLNPGKKPRPRLPPSRRRSQSSLGFSRYG